MIRGLICVACLAGCLCSVVPAQTSCGPYTLRGTWAFTYQGVVVPFQSGDAQPVPVPTVLIGVASIDGQGKLTGAGTGIMGGDVLDFELVDATIEVKSDCTGTAKWGLKAKGAPAAFPGQGIDRIVVLPEGREFMATSVQGVLGKPVYLGSWKRISPLPLPVSW